MVQRQLETAEDLQRDGTAANTSGRPLLLYFSQHFCGFCERLEEEVLRPMVISSQYDDKVMLRKVSIDPGEGVVDFSGERIDNRALFEHFGGIVTPTLILTDGQGHELAKRLVGINTVEFFGWYLDNAINEAIRQMRNIP